MAKVTVRCEFMENAFPAGPIALKGAFSVVEDSRGEHMIFSVDKRDKLCLIMKGEFGQNELINLSSKFGLTENQKVSAFAVSQNKDGKIHLVFAALQSSGFDNLYVVRPMSTKRDEWMAPFTASDLLSGTQSEINIRQILLGTSNDTEHDITEYPQPYLIFRHKYKTTEDFWALTVNAQDKTWFNPNILQMPCNPDQILSKCPGNLPMYRGMFILYREAGTNITMLRFVGYDPTKKNPTIASITQVVPEGTCEIAPLENSQGYTDLLMAGKQLTWRSSQACFKGSKAAPVVLSDDPDLSEPVQFYTAQSSDAVSIWSLNKASLLAYQEFDLPEGESPKPRTPLIPLLEGQSGTDRFTALQHPVLGQKLFVVDKKNNLKMLEQSNDSGLWQTPIEVMIPDSDEMITFKSHTIRIQVDEASGTPLAKQNFRLCSSTSAELLVNGISMRGTPDGVSVATDDGGTLTVIIKSDGMSGPVITLKDATNDKKVLAAAVTVDTMKKLWTTVDDMSSAEGLKSAKLSDGTSFLKPGTDTKDVDAAATALKNLRTAREDIKNPGSVKLPDKPAPPPRQNSGGLWGAWYWLKDKISKVTDWVFEKIGQAWKFVVKIAGKVWEFVCDNFPQIAEAVQAVLSAIGKGLEWIRDKIFAALGWDDIIDTKNILVNLTTQGLLWGADGMAILEAKADEAFNDMRKSVRELKGKKLPPGLAKAKVGKNPEKVENSKEEKTLNSPTAQYGNYHLKHSGNSLNARKEGETSIDRLIKRLGNVWTQIEQLVSRLGDNVSTIFKSSDVDVETIMTTLGVDLLDDVLGVFQSVVVGLLGAVSDLIVDLADGLNKPISIPILSPLYKWLTKAELTILDLVCLCIAIPSTILFKAVSGKKPKDLEGIEPLTKYNAMKGELDQRMGRARQEQGQSIKMASLPSPQTSNTDTSTLSIMSQPTSDISKISSSTPQQDSISSKTVPQEKSEGAKTNQKRFSKSAYQASSILKGGLPLGQLLWYQFYTWPRLFAPEGAYNPKSALLSAAAKLILWLGSFVSVASYSKDDILKGNFDISEKWKDPWFAHRFRIWLVGGLPVVGAMGGKYCGYVLGMLSSVVQTVMLAILHIESWTVGAGYSVYLCIEEWSKMAGKLATNFSGLTKGGYGYGAAIALGFTYTGSSMHMIRCGLEFNGNREIMVTGLDLD